jgi:hypothetical protein
VFAYLTTLSAAKTFRIERQDDSQSSIENSLKGSSRSLIQALVRRLPIATEGNYKKSQSG